MRRFAYIGIRKAPGGLLAALLWLSGMWASADSDGFLKYGRVKWATIDVSATGTLVAATIAVYLAALWLTRNWDRSDREFYKDQLRRIYDDVARHKQVVITSPSDEHLRECEAAFQQLEANAQAWLMEWMGQSAVTKYIRANGYSRDYPWVGGHAPEVRDIRNHLLDWLGDRLINVEAMMESDTWDHPASLSSRRWAGRWQRWKAKLHG